ncbi:MAG TPA: hypothetical protein VF332_07875 [Vicinamibacterales bacterium]
MPPKLLSMPGAVADSRPLAAPPMGAVARNDVAIARQACGAINAR